MSENEEKKKYLRRYKEAKKKEKRISEQIAELRSNKMHPSAASDGMPKGYGHSDLSGYMARLDELIRNLDRERMSMLRIYAEILEAISKVPNTAEQEVLERKYLLDQAWEEIAVKMGYTYRHVTRLHGFALENFKIPEKMS